MAVAFVKALQAAGGTSTVNSTTIAVTTNGAVAAGNHIIGFYTNRLTSATTLSSVAATGATFQVDGTASGVAGTTEGWGIFSAYCASGLASATTITATLSAASTRKTMSCFEFSGLDTTTWAYSPAVTGNGNPAPASPVTIGTLSGLTAGDLVVSVTQYNNSTGTIGQITAGSGWTTPTAATGGNTIVGASSWDESLFQYIAGVGGTSQAVTFAWSVDNSYAGGGVAYHQASSPAHRRRPRGVWTPQRIRSQMTRRPRLPTAGWR